MRTNRRTYTINASPATIDLSLMYTGEVNAGALMNAIADLSIEMEGNDAEATIKAKGSFANSTFKDVTDGSFAIGGGMVSIKDHAIKELQITTTSTFPIYLNVTRQIRNI